MGATRRCQNDLQIRPQQLPKRAVGVNQTAIIDGTALYRAIFLRTKQKALTLLKSYA
jgi:hypothetical protein